MNSQFSDRFTAYGIEPFSEFAFDAVASQYFATYWAELGKAEIISWISKLVS